MAKKDLTNKSPIVKGSTIIYRSGKELCIGEVYKVQRAKGRIHVITAGNFSKSKTNLDGTHTCALEWVEPLQIMKLEKDETRVVRKMLKRFRDRYGFTSDPWFKKE